MDLWSFPHWTTDSNNWRAGNNHLFQLWMMTVVQSFHVMWEKHAVQQQQTHNTVQTASSSTAAAQQQQQQRENVSQHTALVPLKETELTSKAVYVLVCTREYFPSQLYMEITVLCGLHATAGYSACLTGPLGSDSNTNTPDPLTRCGATRVPCRGTWRL